MLAASRETVVCRVLKLTSFRMRTIHLKKRSAEKDAAMGIRTPVAGVKGPHDWPDYTIAAKLLYLISRNVINRLWHRTVIFFEPGASLIQEKLYHGQSGTTGIKNIKQCFFFSQYFGKTIYYKKLTLKCQRGDVCTGVCFFIRVFQSLMETQVFLFINQ